MTSTTSDTSKTESGSNKKSELTPPTYTVGSFNGIGNSIYENIIPFLAILLGSAGVIQGLIVSIRQLGGALMNPVWGRLSDYFGRRRFLMLGNFSLAIISFITPFAPDPVFLLGLLVLQTLAMAVINPTWNGYLGDITSVARRGHVLSRIGFIITIIGNLGLLFTVFFLGDDVPSESLPEILVFPFFFAGASYLFAMILSIFLPTNQRRKRPKSLIPKITIKEIKFNRIFVRLIVVEIIFFFAWSAAWPLFPFITLDISKTWLDVGLLTFAMAIIIAPSQFAGGYLIKRFSSKKVIIVSRFMIIFPPILFSVAAIYHSIELIYLSNALVGLSLGAAGIATVSIILNNAPEDSRATYMALYAMVLGIAGFIGSTVMGGFLELLSGNTTPPIETVIFLLVMVSAFRFIAWFSYFFLFNDEKTDKNS